MDLGLTDRVAIVTGASRGIGHAIALTLAREGCRVALCARGEARLREAAESVEALAGGGRVLPLPLDMTDADAADRLVRTTAGRWGAVDIIVNNVGGSRRMPFVETRDEDWRELLDLNLLTGLRLTRAALPGMIERGRGSVLFVSSIWGREAGLTGASLYVTAKAAVIAASKMLALELAPSGVRVNTIAPGSILFPGGSWERRVRDDPEALRRFIEQQLPMGRFGTPEEVAELAAFLVSDRASLITGACVPADGAQGKSLE